eukprot:CAMPEP_0206139406 /NCGR_PEP_ID=MMETSP1473-20131121/5871_1 /ASSEMBLY_ACC=CAM_ASM_001109 /TAXON_ID=1461547 /ORGANISM="Stichococcus sp, Strain RCC1054" /LENGTH=234 /DNA_ID=CAMNT_0053533187 /DNA_START=225 /DNA_END=929 /DNA_ORIENTATION=-
MDGPVAVVGGSGKVAQQCVKQLVAKDHKVVAVGRDASKLEELFGPSPLVKCVSADVEKPETLKAAFQGVSGVINASSGKGYWSAEGVDNKGSGNVAQAARAAGAKHVVMVSSALVTTKNRLNPVRMMLNSFRWGLMDSKLRGEDRLRNSGIPYTVVRPGGLTDDGGGASQLLINQGDKGSPGRVSRADVAAVCIAALEHPEKSAGRTIELAAQFADPPTPLTTVFDGTVPDSTA